MAATLQPDVSGQNTAQNAAISVDTTPEVHQSVLSANPPQPPQPPMKGPQSLVVPIPTGHPPPPFTPPQFNTIAPMPHSAPPYLPIYPSVRDRGYKRKQEAITPAPRDMSYGSHIGRLNRHHSMAPPSTDKNNKGLRHFSLRVCQKVKQKGVTSYVEVAEELVLELTALETNQRPKKNDVPCDSKNIRRRVYDALNVLMAMNIITKEKKEIRWVGLPSTFAQECVQLQEEKRAQEERIKKKRSHLYELIIQQVAFKNLTRRNLNNERRKGQRPDLPKCIQLPYIIVNTPGDTQIDCEMADDGTEYFFEFTQPFEILDEIEVLKRMHLADGLDNGTSTNETLANACSLVPPQIVPHIHDMVHHIARPSLAPLDNYGMPPTPIWNRTPFYPPYPMPQQANLMKSHPQTPLPTATATNVQTLPNKLSSLPPKTHATSGPTTPSVLAATPTVPVAMQMQEIPSQPIKMARGVANGKTDDGSNTWQHMTPQPVVEST